MAIDKIIYFGGAKVSGEVLKTVCIQNSRTKEKRVLRYDTIRDENDWTWDELYWDEDDMSENPCLWYFNHYTMTWNIWSYPIEGLESLLYIQRFVRNFLTKIRNKPTDETSKRVLECELPPEIVNEVLSYFEYTPEHKKINHKRKLSATLSRCIFRRVYDKRGVGYYAWKYGA